ncbi:type II toxin-antitoxin system RelE/ParE family toxin [Ochrobactrum sp. MYb379]|uniref:type II toxin-antitoxin system RelE/ParE family toxin n=1 Tax=Ochrobactrum sp. MYb379 TaxID=2745275 RepID=UPI0030B07DB2
MHFDRYQLTPLAEADLEEIWVYTLREWPLDQPNIYIHDVIDAFEGLKDGSKRGRPTDIRAGYFKYAVGSHVIYFQEQGNNLVVIRVLHGRMDVIRHL